MKITQEVRDYAAQEGMETGVALAEGRREKAVEFKQHGSEIYVKT